MITYVNSSNADSYSLLYSEVTELLRTHTDEGYTKEEAEKLGKVYSPVLTFESIELTKDQFLSFEGDLYKDAEGQTKVAIDQADEEFKDIAEDGTKTFYQPEAINSLNEFFGHLADIAKIEPRYTRLPLDEDFFSIDLNTRKITVPSSLSSIAVQGDEMSEIVYFKVKRYYDAADLYGTPEVTNASGSYRQNPMDIYIQWERPAASDEIAAAASEGKTISTVKGVSMPYIIDAESEPGYIIFGWPLSSSITKVSGTISFSVRFYVYNDGQITYSLSTLTNSVKVNSGLDYDLEYIKEDNTTATSFVIDNKTQAIIDRYVNSVVNNSEVDVAIPVFTIGLSEDNTLCTDANDKAITLFKITDDAGKNGVVSTNLGLNENTGYHSEPVTMYIQAKTDGDGTLSYYWKKSDLNGVAEKFNDIPTTVMLPTKDTSKVSGKTYYYYENNDTNTGALIVSNQETFSTIQVDSKDVIVLSDNITWVYEKYSKAIFDSIGYYYAVANNRVHNNIATTRTPADTKDENNLTILNLLKISEPNLPVFKTSLPEHAYVDLTNGKKETVNDTYHTTLSVDVNNTNDAGLVTYTWEYKPAGSDTFAPLAVEADKVRYDGEEDTGIYTINGTANYNEAELVSGPKMDDSGYANSDGVYRVTIKNHLNRHSKEEMTTSPSLYTELVKDADGNLVAQKDANGNNRPAICVATNDTTCVSTCRVTHKPSSPYVIRVGELGRTLDEAQKDDGLTVQIVAAENNPDKFKYKHEEENGEYHTDEDHYIYKWYRYVPWDEATTQDDTNNAENGLYVSDADDYLMVAHDGIEMNEITTKSGLKFNAVTITTDGQNVADAKEIDDGPNFKPTVPGRYYCEVINVYNEAKASLCSPFFVVDDSFQKSTT